MAINSILDLLIFNIYDKTHQKNPDNHYGLPLRHHASSRNEPSPAIPALYDEPAAIIEILLISIGMSIKKQ